MYEEEAPKVLEANGDSRQTRMEKGSQDILIANKTANRHTAPAPPHQTPRQTLPALAVGLVAVGVVHGDGLRARTHKGVLASAAGGRVQERPRRHFDHERGVPVCRVEWKVCGLVTALLVASRNDIAGVDRGAGKKLRCGDRLSRRITAAGSGEKKGQGIIIGAGRPKSRAGLEGPKSVVVMVTAAEWRCGTVSIRERQGRRGGGRERRPLS